ncbi:hypothetical protein GCM10027596_07720 [Nocardioides korecus]
MYSAPVKRTMSSRAESGVATFVGSTLCRDTVVTAAPATATEDDLRVRLDFVLMANTVRRTPG